ncbi:uncharacterized protein LOC142789577 [Rhipicephalus microplus]|uniref:uncharacterized protein LOC142789577 n=1 Tax=Rhipicephalus microplus TaxID=6941 RepID=UPI003F6CB480
MTDDYSSVGHARPSSGTTKKLYQRAVAGPSDGSFQKEEQEPRCLDSKTLDTPTFHSSERSRNHVKSHSREATSRPSSCSPKKTVIEPQLPEDLKYAVHEGIDENTTVDEKTRAIKSSSPAPVTQNQIAACATACNSQSCREENSSLAATSYSSTTSRALWRSCDGCSHSSADAPHTQKVRRTPESCEKGHPGYTLLLGKEANLSIASTKHVVWRIASVARQKGPPHLHTTNSRWLSEGREPGQKLGQRPPKPYFWRASPPRQRAPLERGQAYFIPSMSPGDWCHLTARGAVPAETTRFTSPRRRGHFVCSATEHAVGKPQVLLTLTLRLFLGRKKKDVTLTCVFCLAFRAT